MTDLGQMQRALYEGDAGAVEALIEAALESSVPAGQILKEGLIAGMQVVGEDFKNHVIYVPHVLVAARAMKAGMAVLEPHLKDAPARAASGTIVLGTVKGDLHDIGKYLVCVMAEGAGFHVVDIGVDQPAERFVAAAREHGAGIVGMSALLTTTMPYMKTVVDAFAAADLGAVRICVGGASVSADFAADIGADGYAPDAVAAAQLFSEIYPRAE